MKVYCVGMRIHPSLDDSPLTINVKRTHGYQYSRGQEEKHDCAKCKHRLICLVDPYCDQRFESIQ